MKTRLLLYFILALAILQITFAANCDATTPCSCKDTLVQSRNLTAADPVIVNNCNGDGLYIGAPSIKLDCKDLTINGLGHSKGIFNNGNSGVTIENCQVINFNRGIYINQSTQNTLTGNTLIGNAFSGISHYYSTNSQISDNEAYNNDYGIDIAASDHNRVFDNTANTNDYGIYLERSKHNNVTDNECSSNVWSGIFLWWNSSFNRFIHNNAAHNRNGIKSSYKSGDETWVRVGNTKNLYQNNTARRNNWFGIVLLNATQAKLMNNLVFSNFHSGIYWYRSKRTVAENNTILNTTNGDGLGIWSSINNTVNRNVICLNRDNDIDLRNATQNKGEQNICDKPDGWNDKNKNGCTAICGVSGRVTDGHGHQLIDVNVTLRWNNKTFLNYTNHDGNYTIHVNVTDFFLNKSENSSVKVILEDKGNGTIPYIRVYKETPAPIVPVMVKSKNFSGRTAIDLVHDIDFTHPNPKIVWTNLNNRDRLDDYAAFYRHNYEALNYTLNRLNLQLNHSLPVEIRGWSMQGTSYLVAPSIVRINITDSPYNDWNRADNREWHEFGHHVMADSRIGREENLPPDPPGTQPHGMFDNPTSSDSWVEGWPIFFACAVASENNYPNPQLYQWVSGAGNQNSDIESNYGVADDEEFAIAGILWDLLDEINNTRDNDSIDLNVQNIWNVLNSNQPRGNIQDVYNAFVAAGTGSGDADGDNVTDLNELFISHDVYNDSNNNSRYDAGEVIGITSWQNNSGVIIYNRPDKPPYPGSFVWMRVMDNSTSQQFSETEARFKERYDGVYSYYNRDNNANMVNLPRNVFITMGPNDGYMNITVYEEGYEETEPLQINSSYYWSSIRRPNVTFLFNHTFYLNPFTPTDDFYVNQNTVLWPASFDIIDTGNNGVLIINKSNIYLDCNGANLTGNGNGVGIINDGFNNVTIRNCNVFKYHKGLLLEDATNNIVMDSSFNSNYYGILLNQSDDNLLDHNNARNNSHTGIRFLDSYNELVNWNEVCSNNATDFGLVNSSGFGDRNLCDIPDGWNDINIIGCSGICSCNDSDNDTFFGYNNQSCPMGLDCNDNASHIHPPEDDIYLKQDTILCPGLFNIFDAGKPGVVIVNTSNIVLECNQTTLVGSVPNPTGGSGIMSKAVNVTIRNCTVRSYYQGIHLDQAVNNLIEYNHLDNDGDGIYTWKSVGNLFQYNDASNNAGIGIALEQSENSTIRNNTANGNSYGGVGLTTSVNNTVMHNTLLGNLGPGTLGFGVILEVNASDNTIYRNIADGNKNGIMLWYHCPNNTIQENSASNNFMYGIYADDAENTRIIKNAANFNVLTGIGSFNRFDNSQIIGNIVTGNANKGMSFNCQTPGNCRNLTVRGNNAQMNNWLGLYVEDFSKSRIEHNIADNNIGAGIELRISNSVIINNSADNNYDPLAFLPAFYASVGHNSILINNTAHYNYDGFTINGQHSRVENNAADFNQRCGYWINSLYGGNMQYLENTANNNIRTGVCIGSIRNSDWSNGTACNNNLLDIEVFYPQNFNNTSGDDNICDTTSGWNDQGTSGCTFACGAGPANCTLPHDNLYVTNNTVLCPGFFSISDFGGDGVIIMNADDITLECYQTYMQGTQQMNGKGIQISNRNNITVKGCTIDNYNYGIHGQYVFNSTIRDNHIQQMWSGVNIGDGMYNVIINNSIQSCQFSGIGLSGYLYSCQDNTLANNTLQSNNWGMDINDCTHAILRGNVINGSNRSFRFAGPYERWQHDIDTSNRVNGKPVYYWTGQKDMKVPANAAFAMCISCDNITVEDVDARNSWYGVALINSTDSVVGNVTVIENEVGIHFLNSTFNTIDSSVAEDNKRGIQLDLGSDNNNVSNNLVNRNSQEGIYVATSDRNIIRDNRITANNKGIYLYFYSYYNIVYNNEMLHNRGQYNMGRGIDLLFSENNTIWSNNFTNNTINAYEDSTSNNNDWNTTYGNLWDDYNGIPPYYIPGPGDGVDYLPNVIPTTTTTTTTTPTTTTTLPTRRGSPVYRKPQIRML